MPLKMLHYKNKVVILKLDNVFFFLMVVRSIEVYSVLVMAASVLFSKLGNACLLTLNRPKALNSLNLEMCQAIKAHLTELKTQNKASAMIMKSSGDKAFCAGGDVKLIWEDCMKGGDLLGKGAPGRISSDFFREEYEMNYMLGTSTIPQVRSTK